MLLLAIAVGGYAIYSVSSNLKSKSDNIDFKINSEGVDIEIKKFKVVHENLGRKEWELNADVAKINQQNQTTKMSNVEYTYINKNNRTFKVYADYGTLMNKTNDLNLNGHVKMLIESSIVKERFNKKPTSASQP